MVIVLSRGAPAAWALQRQHTLSWLMTCPFPLLQSALRLKPYFTDAYNNMASALVHKGLIPAAMDCYISALRINPNLVSGLGGLATGSWAACLAVALRSCGRQHGCRAHRRAAWHACALLRINAGRSRAQ